MERALGALTLCAEKIRRRGASRVRAVATQACRVAANRSTFVEKVEARTGLRLNIISPQEEARLAVAGCLNLIDTNAAAVLVLDVGGGSTELSWLDLTVLRPRDVSFSRSGYGRMPIAACLSIPIGVVTLAERFSQGCDHASFRVMVDAVRAEIADFQDADGLRGAFASGRAHLIGTSGAITSLAGLHLGLARYERAKVDGLWMTRAQCEATAERLAGLTVPQRAAEPCIGPDRADLVLAGAAILQAVQEVWPCERVRVADRGLREGLLLTLMSEQRRSSARGGASGVRRRSR
jgi:exopolyphosphatase/guanosine-5'-triphosphate,3'-diphosphate pyrophosphatase